MTVTTKIVITAAVVLLLGGYIYMRQHARDIAQKYKKIQRQRFKSKEPVIIEELIAQINGATQKAEKRPTQKLQPSFAGNAGGPVSAPVSAPVSKPDLKNEGKDLAPPLEPTTISPPVRLPLARQSSQHERGIKSTKKQAQQPPLPRGNLAAQNNKAPELPQTSFIQKPENERLNHPKSQQDNSLQERLSKQATSEVHPSLIAPPPHPTAKSTIEEIQLKDIDLPKFVTDSKRMSDNSSAAEIKESYPVRGQVKTTSISDELVFKEDETLYTHINDYAKWVALQSEHFTLEYYENNTLIENIPLIFNSEDLSRLNGHWFKMFRPIDLNELLSGMNKSKSVLYCSFSRADIEHLRKPALQILDYVEFEASSRYETVLEECAIKEFVEFLNELKSMADQEE